MTEWSGIKGKAVRNFVLYPAGTVASFFAAVGLFATGAGQSGFRSVIFAVVALVPQSICGTILYLKNRKEQAAEKRLAGLLLADDGTGRTEESESKEKTTEIEEPAKKTVVGFDSFEKDIAIRVRLTGTVFAELCDSISKSLSSTTEPISEELLHIRKTNENFLAGIKSYGDEVKNRTTLTTLERKSGSFNRDLQSLSETVRTVFTTLDNRIDSLQTVSNRIGDIADDIGEISEKIRILSFNASIEAARAGNAGKGFRVIAGEIKKLSADTENRLIEIRSTLKETKIIFGNIGTGIEENRQKMLSVVSDRQKAFGTFEQMMNSYFPQLEQLYTGVTNVIASLSKSMDNISPVIQLHEITGQEISNLSLVAGDICEYVDKKLAESHPGTVVIPNKTDAEETAESIRNRLTTEDELKALERGIKKTVPDAVLDMGIDNRDIEFY